MTKCRTASLRLSRLMSIETSALSFRRESCREEGSHEGDCLSTAVASVQMASASSTSAAKSAMSKMWGFESKHISA